MKFLILIYTDPLLMDALPQGKVDAMLRDCFAHTATLEQEGVLIESQMLAAPETARTLRTRKGRTQAIDGPFAEAKEVLGGFNLIEAADMDEAMRIAAEFPWSATGCLEVRPVEDLDAVRRRVGSVPRAAEHSTASG